MDCKIIQLPRRKTVQMSAQALPQETTPDMEKFLDDLAATMYRYAPFTSLQSVIREDLTTYSSELLFDLAELFSTHNPVAEQVKICISYKAEEGLVRDFMAFIPFIPHLSYSYAHDIIQSLHSYPQLPDTTYFSDCGDEVLAQCKALLHVAAGIPHYGLFRNDIDMSSGFADSALVDLIISMPEQSERITSIISDRGTGDPQVICEVLEFDTAALNNGVL